MSAADPHQLSARFKCLRFSPADDEVITEFLEPKIGKKNMGFSLIIDEDVNRILSGVTGPWTEEAYPYFRKNHYWVFVNREPVNTCTDLNPQRMIRYNDNFLGTWISQESNPIFKGSQVIGFKEELVFFTKDNIKTGWHQYEYRRNSISFEEMVVCHLVYDEENLDVEKEAEEGLNVEKLGTVHVDDLLDQYDNLDIFHGDEQFLRSLGSVDVDDLFDQHDNLEAFRGDEQFLRSLGSVDVTDLFDQTGNHLP